jgi:hypothetical protein
MVSLEPPYSAEQAFILRGEVVRGLSCSRGQVLPTNNYFGEAENQAASHLHRE